MRKKLQKLKLKEITVTSFITEQKQSELKGAEGCTCFLCLPSDGCSQSPGCTIAGCSLGVCLTTPFDCPPELDD